MRNLVSNIYSKLDNKIIVLIIFLLSSVMINIPLPLTNSGYLAIYGSDIISLFMLILLFFDIVLNYKNLKEITRITTKLSLVFVFITLVISLLRFSFGNYDLKSLLIPRVFIFSVWFYIMILEERISNDNVINGLRLFIVGLSIVSIFLFFTTAPISYKILQSPAIRTSIQMFAYPLVSYSLFKDYNYTHRRIYLVMLIVSTFGLFISGISSGSRINSLIIPLEIIVMFLISTKENRKLWISIMSGIIIGVVFLVMVYPISYRYRIGSTRSPLFKPIEKLLIIPIYKDSELIDLFNEPRYTSEINKPIGTEEEIDIKIKPEQDTEINVEQDANPETDENESNKSNRHKDDVKEEDKNTSETLVDSLNENTSQSKVDSTNSRLGVWKLAIKDISQKPLIGPGLKYYDIEYSTGSKHIIPPHNFILEYTMGFGIIGIVSFLSVLLYPVYKGLKNIFVDWKKNIKYILVFVLTGGAIAINVLFQPLFLNTPVTLIILSILSMLIVYGRKNE